MATLNAPVKIKRGTHAALTLANPTLEEGQLCLIHAGSMVAEGAGPDGTEMYRIKIGTGAAYNSTLFASFGIGANWTSILNGYLEVADLITDVTLTGGTNSNAPSTTAIKTYVDNITAGVDWKEQVRVATTANITLSGTQTIDGQAIVADDRVLVRVQTAGAENGIYLCKAGAWVRTTDADTADKLLMSYVQVRRGTTWVGTKWRLLTNPITLNTTALVWEQDLGSTYTADGTTLDLVGGQFSLKNLTTFSGTTIPNGSTHAAAFQALETAVEGKVDVATVQHVMLTYSGGSQASTITALADVHASAGFTVAATGWYEGEFFVTYDSAATSTGGNFSIDGTATQDYFTCDIGYSSGNGDRGNIQIKAFNSAAAAASSLLTTNNTAILKFQIHVTVAGTIKLRFATEVSSSAITVTAVQGYIRKLY